MSQTKYTGYNLHTISTVVFIALFSLWLHFVILYIGDKFVDRADNPISMWWAGAWLMSTVFAFINSREAVDDAIAIRIVAKPERALGPAAGWFLRIDILSLLGSLGMALAGYSSVFGYPSATVVDLLLAGGLFFVLQQAWNRADRLRIKRLLREDREARENGN